MGLTESTGRLFLVKPAHLNWFICGSCACLVSVARRVRTARLFLSANGILHLPSCVPVCIITANSHLGNMLKSMLKGFSDQTTVTNRKRACIPTSIGRMGGSRRKRSFLGIGYPLTIRKSAQIHATLVFSYSTIQSTSLGIIRCSDSKYLLSIQYSQLWPPLAKGARRHRRIAHSRFHCSLATRPAWMCRRRLPVP
ncbi:hypothetical protein FIBSPDRAFT_851734 [Athelia psychrophila]|uniref:Uncharacterized protein n=1 Tax=Athelia psychrophila TaxID=1759441 RepID=A0A166SDK7_9AGAM|nr:hypothetical protein FIBSPDRAFT_851734 [Fibularhizoctonia sp. CBS 109695]